MNPSVPLYPLLVAVLVLLVLYAVVRAATFLAQSAGRTQGTIQANTAAIAGLVAKLDEAGKQLAAVPKLLEAVMKIGDAQLQTLQAQRQTGQQNPFGRPTGPLPPRDVDAANMEHEIGEIMRSEGVTREEALMRMNGANGRSVWDSNAVFQDWRSS